MLPKSTPCGLVSRSSRASPTNPLSSSRSSGEARERRTQHVKKEIGADPSHIPGPTHTQCAERRSWRLRIREGCSGICGLPPRQVPPGRDPSGRRVALLAPPHSVTHTPVSLIRST